VKMLRFEDLECWNAARKLVNLVYKAVRSNRDFQKDFRLNGQITAAAVSAMSNTAEGFSRRSNKEFVPFLFIAKSSATEVQSEAYVALDQRYIDRESFDAIYARADEVSKLCSGLITYLLKKAPKEKSSRPPVTHKALGNHPSRQTQ
jgi:four helix bundle protein